MSKPDAPLNICEMETKNEISEEQYEDMFRSTIRIICTEDQDIERFVVKTRSTCALLLLPLSKMYAKNVKQIFMYRNSLETTAAYSVAAATPDSVLQLAYADNDFISSILLLFRKQFRFENQCRLRSFPGIPLERPFKQLAHTWANLIILGRYTISQDNINRNNSRISI